MYSNHVNLTGFLGQNAEVKSTRNNARFTVLSVATKRSWRDLHGQWQSETTWHRCIVWGKLGEFASTLGKGAHVRIEGEIRHRDYTPKGATSPEMRKSITEIRVSSILRLDRSAETGGDHPDTTGAA